MACIYLRYHPDKYIIYAYSPECLEYAFSELRMQHRAYPASTDRGNAAFTHAYRATLPSLATPMDRYARSWLYAGRITGD